MRINFKVIGKILEKHGPSILTGMAAVGVVLTGYLTHKATEKTRGAQVLAMAKDFTDEVKTCDGNIDQIDTDTIVNKELDGWFKRYWKNYIPPAIAGVGTIACIIGANYWHLSKESAMAAAVAFYKASESELKDAIKEKFGDEALTDIKKDIAKKRLEDERPPWEPKNSNKMTIYEPYTKQWFRASQQEILWAELTANKMLQQTWKVRLNDILALYDGCKKTKLGNIIGWSLDDEMFMEAVDYSPSGAAWITFCPQQITNNDGSTFFQMEYEIHPNELPIEELPFRH